MFEVQVVRDLDESALSGPGVARIIETTFGSNEALVQWISKALMHFVESSMLCRSLKRCDLLLPWNLL